MKSIILSLCVGLGIACGAAHCAPVASPAASAPSAPASAGARATRSVAALCAERAASASPVERVPTSKVRHIPVEGDPCADSRGVAPPSGR